MEPSKLKVEFFIKKLDWWRIYVFDKKTKALTVDNEELVITDVYESQTESIQGIGIVYKIRVGFLLKGVQCEGEGRLIALGEEKFEVFAGYLYFQEVKQ